MDTATHVFTVCRNLHCIDGWRLLTAKLLLPCFVQPADSCSAAIVKMLQLVTSNDFLLVCYQSHGSRQTTPIATAPSSYHVRVESGWVLLNRVHPTEMVCHGPSCLFRRGSLSPSPPSAAARHCRTAPNGADACSWLGCGQMYVDYRHVHNVLFGNIILIKVHGRTYTRNSVG